MENKKCILFLMIIIFVFIKEASAIQINEIMYNPEGDDNNLEFIEIFDINKTNIANWTIGDSEENDTLNCVFKNSDYSLIVEDGFNFSYYNLTKQEINFTVCYVGATIGNNLNNDFDEIYLYFNGTLINFTYYNDSIGGDGNGHSIEFFNNSFYEGLNFGGTPGKPNSLLFQTPKNESGYDNETNSTQQNCDFGASIELSSPSFIENTIETYFNGDKLEYKIKVNGESDFEMIYWIEDFNGDILKSKVVSTNDNSRSWTINIDKEYSIVLIKAEIKLNCSNETIKKSKSFVVFNKEWEEEKEEEEIIEIEKSNVELVKYDNKIKEGEPFLIEFITRKGDTGKTKLDFWFDEKNKYSVYLYEKNSEQKFKIPMVVKCLNGSFNKSVLNFKGVEIDKSFNLDLDVDCIEEEIIECNEPICAEQECNCEETIDKDFYIFDKLNNTMNQTFESPSSKSRKIVPYVLGASSVIALITAFLI